MTTAGKPRNYLNMAIDPGLYARVKSLAPQRKMARFCEEAIDQYCRQLETTLGVIDHGN